MGSANLVTQTRRASAPELAAVRCAADLLRRIGETDHEGEREAARLALAELGEKWHLGVGTLRAHAPDGSFPGSDDGVLLRGGLPWWRGLVAAACVRSCGFSGSKPWGPVVAHDGAVTRGDLAMVIVGVRSAVTSARVLYASACVHVAARSAGEPTEIRDAYALGVAIRWSREAAAHDAALSAIEDVEARTKIVLAVPEVDDDSAAGRRAREERAISRGEEDSAGLAVASIGLRLRFLGFALRKPAWPRDAAPVWLVDPRRAEEAAWPTGSGTWRHARRGRCGSVSVDRGEVWVAYGATPPQVAVAVAREVAELLAEAADMVGYDASLAAHEIVEYVARRSGDARHAPRTLDDAVSLAAVALVGARSWAGSTRSMG